MQATEELKQIQEHISALHDKVRKRCRARRGLLSVNVEASSHHLTDL